MKRVGILVLVILMTVPAGLFVGSRIARHEIIYESNGAQLASVYRSLTDLCSNSSLIVVGSFTGRTQVLDNPANKDSKVKVLLQELEPSQLVKGAAANPVWVATYARNDKGSWIGAVGQAVYQPGSDYVLFLTQTEEGHYWTTGAWQGSFRVQNGRVWSRYELHESDESLLETKGIALGSFMETLSPLLSPSR